MKSIFFVFLLLPFLLIRPAEKPDSLEKLLPSKSGKEKLLLLEKLTEHYYKTNPQKALAYAEEALTLLSNVYDSHIDIIINNNKGLALYFAGNAKDALLCCTKSKSLAEKYNDQAGLGLALNSLGKIHSYQGDYRKSLEYHQLSLEIRKKLGNKTDIASSLFALGNVNLFICSYQKSLEYYIKSSRYFEETGNKQGVCDALVNSGIVNSKLGHNKEAINNYLGAVNILEGIHDKISLSSALINIGITYKDIGKYDSSLAYYSKALILKKELGHKKGLAIIYNNIGEVYRVLKNYNLAYSNFKQSLEIKEELDDKRGIARTLINIGMIHNETGHYSTAAKYFDDARKIAEKFSALDLLEEIFTQIYELYKSQKHYDKALLYHEFLSQVQDSIKNENINSRIKELEITYETEKKEKEINLLKKDNLLKAANLQNQSLQRNLLIIGLVLTFIIILLIYNQYRFKSKSNIRLQAKAEDLANKLVEVQLNIFKTQLQPHFLFNTLNAISVLVRKADNTTANKMISGLSEFLRYTLYNFDNQFVPLGKEMAILKHYIGIQQIRFSDKMKVNMDIPEELQNAKIPNLLLQPLVENSIKHGISKLNRDGMISIKAEHINNKLRLYIIDNGPGLQDKWEKIKHKGIGTTNTEARLNKIYNGNNHFTIYNNEDGGATAIVEIPFEIQESAD